MKQIFFMILILAITACSNSGEETSKTIFSNLEKSNDANNVKSKSEENKNELETDSDRSSQHTELDSNSIIETIEEQASYDDEYPEFTIAPATEEEANQEEVDNLPDPEPENSYDFHAYEAYDSFLKKYVSSSGKVNYAGINGDRKKLNAIAKEFNDQYPTRDWTYNQKLAFWINTYNVFTIKLIIDNYPTTSITKIATKPWEIKSVKLNGHTYSLDHVENQIIRKQFNEPRIHFALNCASESCPILLNKAYKASTVSSQLTSQTKKFLNDLSKNTFGKREITISPIFKWYAEDFTNNGESVISFINKYRTEQLKDQKIKYSTYSWELND